MLIRVHYYDDSYGSVDDSALEELIENDRIIGFLRASGWVRIGRDPIRIYRTERRRKRSIINTYV